MNVFARRMLSAGAIAGVVAVLVLVLVPAASSQSEPQYAGPPC